MPPVPALGTGATRTRVRRDTGPPHRAVYIHVISTYRYRYCFVFTRVRGREDCSTRVQSSVCQYHELQTVASRPLLQAGCSHERAGCWVVSGRQPGFVRRLPDKRGTDAVS